MNEQLHERIDRYLEGRMSEEEKTAFESEAEGNEELSSLLAIYSRIETEMRENTIYTNQEASLRQTLGRLNGMYFTGARGQGEAPTGMREVTDPAVAETAHQPGRVRHIKSWRPLMVAAAFIGVAIVGITWYINHNRTGTTNNGEIVKKTDRKADSLLNQSRQDSALNNNLVRTDSNQKKSGTGQRVNRQRLHAVNNTALFAANFVRDAAPEVKPDNLDLAFDLYEQGDDKAADAAFKEAGQTSRGEETDKKLTDFYRHYYRAQIYLTENNAEKAIPELKNALQQSPGAGWKVKAQWYLALAYLKNGDVGNAVILLDQIPNNKQAGIYKRKAEQMITQLKDDN